MKRTLINFIFSVGLLMLSLFSILLPTYSFWNHTEQINYQIISIGEWIHPWDSTITYQTGQIVEYNGTYYIALKKNSNKTPGFHKVFWGLY